MKKISEKGMMLLLVSFITLFCSMMQAQVTIGSLFDPQKGALLDLKEKEPANPSDSNSDKGVLFPKVALTDAKSLTPLLSGQPTVTDLVKMRGMIVYNVNENANGIDVGLSVWNGEEWMSVVGGGANKAAVFTIDWDNVIVNGTYIKGKLLTPSNSLSVPVTVSKKGIYSITATSANGYAFSASGEFMAAGSYTLTLNSLGTPAASSTSDLLTFLNNNIDITHASKKIGVNVDDVSPEYTCNCATIQKNSISLKTGQNAAGELVLEISAPLDAIGAKYNITTNTIDGVKFSGTGTLQGGNQRVYLTASGKPAKSGQHTFQISTNSTSPNATTCSVNLSIAGRKINVLILSEFYGLLRWKLDRGHVHTLLNNTTLFGPNSSYCAIEGFNIEHKDHVEGNLPTLTTTKYDIVILSYNAYPRSNQIANVVSFLNAGGVFILCSDDAERGKPGLLNTVVGSGFSCNNNAGDNGVVYPFATNNNSPILNGLYENLTGKKMGLDGGTNRFISIPSNRMNKVEVIASKQGNLNEALMLRVLNVPLIVCSDGGVFTGRSISDNTDSYTNEHPVILSNNLPAPKSMNGGTVHNAHLFVNIMMWAVNERLRVKP